MLRIIIRGFLFLASIACFAHASFAAQANRLIMSHENFLSAHTFDGNQISSTPIAGMKPSERALDLIQLEDGRIVIVINGDTGKDRVVIYDGSRNSWKRISVPRWGLERFALGNIAVLDNYAFVLDQYNNSEVLRINLRTSEVERLLVSLFHTYRDLIFGPDGFLYIIQDGDFSIEDPRIIKYNPDTLEIDSSITLRRVPSNAFSAENGPFGIAVDSLGFFYTFVGKTIQKRDAEGNFVTSLDIGSLVIDIDINDKDMLVVTKSGGSVSFIGTDLQLLNSFSIGATEERLYVAYTDLSIEDLPQLDSDFDRVEDKVDNCKFDSNPNQSDINDNGIGDVCDGFDLLSFVPSIVGGIKANIVAPQWGITNSICCPSSSATLTLSDGETTLSSTLPSCSSEPTFSGFAPTLIGLQSFSGELNAPACGPIPFEFDFEMEEGFSYEFELRFDEGQIRLFVSTEEIPEE